MYNKKNLAVIFSFCTLSIMVLTTGLNSSNDEADNLGVKTQKVTEKSYFKNVHYFKLENFLPSIELKAKRLDITDNILLEFISPQGNLKSEKDSYFYIAETGEMDQDSKVMKLNGEVKMSGSNLDFAAGSILFNGKTKMMYGRNQVAAQVIDAKTLDIIKVKAKSFDSNVETKDLRMSGEVKGRLIRQRAYEAGLKFESNEFELNSLESRVKMHKAVKIYRNNYYLQAENAEIFLENFNKKLKYYELYDDVKLEEKLTGNSSKEQLRRAYAEKLEGHQRTGKIILTGAPRVEQGEDIIKGYQITLRENVELVEVDDSQSNFSLKRKK